MVAHLPASLLPAPAPGRIPPILYPRWGISGNYFRNSARNPGLGVDRLAECRIIVSSEGHTTNHEHGSEMMTTATKTTGRKIDGLARVTRLDTTDGMTATGVMDVRMLADGAEYRWYPDVTDFRLATEYHAPVRVGDEIALEAYAYPNGRIQTLRRVRYVCRGRAYRGAAWHRDHKAN